jgi:hypothetical protein
VPVPVFQEAAAIKFILRYLQSYVVNASTANEKSSVKRFDSGLLPLGSPVASKLKASEGTFGLNQN